MTKQKMPTPEEFEAITELVALLIRAKIVEAEAKVSRIELEAKIAALVPGKEEGQRTINLANKTKVVVERGLIYKADIEAIEALDLSVWAQISPPIQSKTTRSLDVLGYKWYKENYPEAFAEIARHVEVKPKKTAITVKLAK